MQVKVVDKKESELEMLYMKKSLKLWMNLRNH